MLTEFTIENLKTIRHLQLSLGRLTVLVGPNACGKSSILQGIEYFCAMRDTAPQQIFIDSAALEHIRTRGVAEPLVFTANLPGSPIVNITWNGNDRDPDGALTIREGSGPVRDGLYLWHEPLTQILDESEKLKDIARRIPIAKSVRFEFDQLAAPAMIRNDSPTLAPDGSGLAATLANLALQYPADFARIKDATVSVIPELHDIRIRPATVHAPITRSRTVRFSDRRNDDNATSKMPGHELIFDTSSGEGIPAHAMSDGTMRLLGLLTLVLGRNRPSLILLDDVERGIHPRAQYELIQLLRRALKEHAELQIVATTHSADLLDYLEPEEIRLLWLEDGATQGSPMTEHPKYERWKDLMTPSELWGEIERPEDNAS